MKTLRSKPVSQVSAIRTADGCLVSDAYGQQVRSAEYFEQLFTMDPPSRQLQSTRLQTLDADAAIDESAPSIDVKEDVAKLKGEKVAGNCNICAKLLKVGGKTMIRGLYSGIIPPD